MLIFPTGDVFTWAVYTLNCGSNICFRHILWVAFLLLPPEACRAQANVQTSEAAAEFEQIDQLYQSGTNHLAKADYKLAIEALTKCVQQSDGTLGTNHSRSQRAVESLADAYVAVGNGDDALLLQNRLLTALEAKVGREHPNVSLRLTALASIYLRRGDFQRAAEFTERSLNIIEQAYGREHSAYGLVC